MHFPKNNTNFINKPNADTNCNHNSLQNNLHGIIDKLSCALKTEIDGALKALIDKSNEYDETNRIIMTLPVVRRFVQNAGPNVTYTPIDVFSNIKTYDDHEQPPPSVSEPTHTHIEMIVTELETASEEEGEEEEEEEEMIVSDDYESELSLSELIQTIELESDEEHEPDEEEVEPEEDEAEEEVEPEDDEAEVDEAEEEVEAEDDEAGVDVDEAEEADEAEEEVDEAEAEAEAEEEVDEAEAEAEAEEEVEAEEADETEEEVEADEAEEAEEDEAEEEADEEAISEAEENVTNEEEEEEDGEEVFEVEIEGVTYFTNNVTHGTIYEVDENGDPGSEVGEFVEGIPLIK